MTKIAQLPNGHEIHFPDHVADSEMDATVKRHMGVAPSPQTADLLKGVTDAIAAHAAKQDTAHSDATAMTPHDRDQQAKYRAATLDTHRQGHLMAQRNNQELISALAPFLKLIATSGPAIVKALNGLTATIAEIGRAHIEIAGGDREIIPDQKTGKPSKMRINRRTKV